MKGGKKTKKKWGSGSTSQCHSVDTSQTETMQTGLLQGHERDAKQDMEQTQACH